MLVIKDLHKYYKDTSGNLVHALRGINLEFESKGFVVILGKSGSGKSTLLNILGGLDSYDKGEVIVKDKNINDFKRHDLDSYRNTYVGFVFQEFYIIDEFTVGKNIALALELQRYPKSEINEKVKEVLHHVDLDGYENRKPSEISGGQKQRIAIARALVKSPPIILVDEPTGNLDSETGKIILEKLKELSKEKLVIMVTHDQEFARIYGDRIIEFKDGEVTSDVLNDDIPFDLESDDQFNLKKSSLSFLNAFKLSISSFLSKKFHLILMTLIFITSLVFVGIATTFTFYDIATATNLTFKKDNITYIPLVRHQERCLDEDDGLYCYNQDANVRDEDIISLREHFPSHMFTTEYNYELPLLPLNENHVRHMIDYSYYHTQGFNKISIIDHVNDMFPLRVGTYPTQEGEILISDYMATVIVDLGIIEGVNSFEGLLGQKLIDTNEDVEFTISGIVKTDYERFNHLKQSTKYWDFKEDSPFVKKRELHYQHLYMTQETFENNVFMIRNQNLIGLFRYNNYRMVNEYISFYESNQSKNYLNNLIFGHLPKEKNEIVVSHTFIEQKLPFINFNINDIENSDELKLLLGESFNFTTDVYINDEVKRETITFKIVGIMYADPNVTSFRSHTPILIDEEMFEYLNEVRVRSDGENFKIDSQAVTKLVENDSRNARMLKEIASYNLTHQTEYSEILVQLSSITSNSTELFYMIGIVFIIFTSILILTYITSSINAKQKDIGTLRAIGARGIDVAKIFITEGLLISILSSIIGIILYGVVVNLINTTITDEFNTALIILYINKLSILIIFLLSVVIVTLSSLIPVFRITYMKPIDAIKRVE